MRKLGLVLISAGALFLLQGCGGGGGNGGGGNPQVASHFRVTAPAAVTAGTAFNITVTALDAANNIVASYSGTVHFTSDDARAALPANSTLTNGMKSFSGTLETVGSRTITAADTLTPAITGTTGAIQVSKAVMPGGFTSTGSMASPRVGHTATLLKDGNVLIIGGQNSTGILATAEIFNPSTGAFAPTGSMGTPRVEHTATLLANGKVLVTGGSGGNAATAEIFDLSTGIFSPTGSMATARVGHTATLLNDGRVLVAGGGSTVNIFGPLGDNGTASAEFYDPNSGQFSSAGNMISTRIYHAATLLPSGEVLLAGGITDPNGTALGDLFLPASSNFTSTADGGTMALHVAAVLLADGKAFLAGGELAASPCGISADFISTALGILFDGSNSSFTAAADMFDSRISPTATLLTSGHVLVTGGAKSATTCDRGIGTTTYLSLSSAEIFDSASGTFAKTGSMLSPRTGHTAILLGNGAVLVVGGVDASDNALATAEIFQ